MQTTPLTLNLQNYSRDTKRNLSELLGMVQHDSFITSINANLLITDRGWIQLERDDIEKIYQIMPRNRWVRYNQLFRELKLRGGVKTGEDGIAFDVDTASIANGASRKGFMYSLVPRKPCLKQLDNYEFSDMH